MGWPRSAYIVSAIGLVIAIHIFAARPPFPNFWECLKEWQDLVAGGLALLGAYWALMGIRRQIEQSEKQHKDEIARRRNAARVALPLALAEVNTFVLKIVHNIAEEIECYSPTSKVQTREAAQRSGMPVAPFSDVVIPNQVIVSFQQFVETLQVEKEVRHISELISEIQILKARYESVDFSHVDMELYLYGRLVDAAKIQFLNDSLFNFGRFLDDQSFAVVGEMSDADAWESIRERGHKFILLRGMTYLSFDRVDTLIDSRKERGETPWLKKFELV
jgi:hypothetical protein